MSQQWQASDLQDPAFLQLPALAPPPSVIPDFASPENKGPRLIIAGAILLAFVVLALANRAYTKLCIVRKTSWDDLTVSLSAVGAIASYAACVFEIRNGPVGRHQYEQRVGDILSNDFLIPTYVIALINVPTLWVTKFTFALLYLQLFGPMRWLRLSIYIGATLFTVFYWGISVVLFVLWSPKPGETWPEVEILPQVTTANRFAVPVAAGGMMVDVWLFVLPLVAVHKLQLHKTRRVGLTVIFSTGLIAVAASAVSIYFRWKVDYSEDKTWTALEANLLYLIEVDAGIITACMPSFAKVLHRHLLPWATLKPRLELISITGPSKGSKKSRSTVSKSSRPTHSDNLNAGYELESLKSVKSCTIGATRETLEDDRVHLTHDA